MSVLLSFPLVVTYTFPPPPQITDRLIMSAMMRSVLMFNGNLGNSLWLMALGGPVGRCVSVMLNKNIYTEVGHLRRGTAWGGRFVGKLFASSTAVHLERLLFLLQRVALNEKGQEARYSVLE